MTFIILLCLLLELFVETNKLQYIAQTES